MKIGDCTLPIVVQMIILLITRVGGRAIPDFYTDEDLNAWHKFGLRSFYGPWSVIARKPNGDLISYADYGAAIPSDFHPISMEAINDDVSNSGIDNFDDNEPGTHSNLTSQFFNIAAGNSSIPYSIEAFATGIPNLNGLESLLGNSRILLDDRDEAKYPEKSSVNARSSGNKEDKRDTLELIGIVGVIDEVNDDSLENNEGTSVATGTESDSSDENSSIANDLSIFTS